MNEQLIYVLVRMRYIIVRHCFGGVWDLEAQRH